MGRPSKAGTFACGAKLCSGSARESFLSVAREARTSVVKTLVMELSRTRLVPSGVMLLPFSVSP